MSGAARVPGLARPSAIAAWCLYDWANSAFPAVITTFVFATYFTQSVAGDPVTGTAQWSRAIAVAGFIIAFLSPVTGAIADASGRRKPWLAAFTAFTVAMTALLWYVRPEPSSVPLAVVAVALATVGFEVATVFYNALLPELAPSSHIGRVSGWGWGLGYVGGIVCLVILLFGFIQTDVPPFGLDKASAEHVRIAGPFSALWIAVFALPLFVLVPDAGRTRMGIAAAARQGIEQLIVSVRSLRSHPAIAWYLFAQMVYADGLNTLFAFGGIYAAGTFGMKLDEVILFGVALNVTAGIGAFAFAWIDDWIGARRTVAIGLACLMAISAALLIIESKAWFWALGLFLGAFFGPVQAASRSLMARLAAPEHRAQMFGLFALSGRITSFVGPAVLGWATLAFDSQRAGMATVLLFFGAGLAVLMTKVPEAR